MKTCCCIRPPMRNESSQTDIGIQTKISTVSYDVDNLYLSDMRTAPASPIDINPPSPASIIPLHTIYLNLVEPSPSDSFVAGDTIQGQTNLGTDPLQLQQRGTPSVPGQGYGSGMADQDDNQIDVLEPRYIKRRFQDRVTSRVRLHQRTARILGIIVTVFLVCWIPFVVLFPVNSYCNCVPTWIYNASYWTAYLNSTLNPFLYGFSGDFRKAFRRLVLKCCKRTKETQSLTI